MQHLCKILEKLAKEASNLQKLLDQQRVYEQLNNELLQVVQTFIDELSE